VFKKFTFNLEKVLNLRSWNEETARLELGRAISALTAVEQSLARNDTERHAVHAADFGGNLVNAMQALDSYHKRLEDEKKRLLVKKADAEKTVAEASEKWHEAAAQKKALENLKDKRKAEYKKAALAAEDMEMDEIAQAGYSVKAASIRANSSGDNAG
jgi:flagellar FliJ protein